MQVLVVYESMFGNTHAVADAVAEGLGAVHAVEVCAVEDAAPGRVAEVDAVVVGGPTHAHGLSWSTTRQVAVDEARKVAAQHDEPLEEHLDDAATGEGLRTWFHHVPRVGGRAAAAFDTRAHGAVALTGSAGRGIARRLRHHGFAVVADPESFVVDEMDGPLHSGELDRARRWGRTLADLLPSASSASEVGQQALH